MHLVRIALASGLILAGALSTAPALAQQPAPGRCKVEPPACRELERQLAPTESAAGLLALNVALVASADIGCLTLAQRLLDAGASLASRDRLGAMPLCHTARAGHRLLVELFSAAGAAIDARN